MTGEGSRVTNLRQEPDGFARAAFLVIVAGIALRSWVLSQRGSLWLDEASLAVNVLDRGFGALLQPLDWGQAAPVGFLWLERTAALTVGSSELALRLWPFVGGCAVLFLTWTVGRRLLDDRAALLATVAMSASLIGIRYSAEAKPYSSDAAVALLLLAAAHGVREHPEANLRWKVLALGGVVAFACSLPSAFVLAGIALVLAVSTGTRARRGALAWCAAAWAATFATLWFVSLRDTASGDYLREYWAPVMLDPSAGDFVARLVRAAASVVAIPLRWTGGLGFTFLALALAAVGFARTVRQRPWAAALLVGPIAVALSASVAGLYPMSDRLAYFAAPAGQLLVAAGAVAAVDRARAAFRGAAFVAVVASVALVAGADSWRIVRAPGSLEPTRALFSAVAAEAARDSTPVYVFARATPAWLYATERWDAPDAARVRVYSGTAGNTAHVAHENFARSGAVAAMEGEPLVVRGRRTELLGLAPGVRYRIAGPTSRDGPAPGWADEEARRIAASARPSAWIVASHFFEGTPRDELRPLLEALDRAGLAPIEERRGGRDALALRVLARAPARK